MDTKVPKVITPVEVVQAGNILIKGIAEISEKWHKRWPDIDKPWPVEGTLNPDVIKTMRVLLPTYKAHQKKGKKGEKHKQKRQMELAVLQLFENEGQKLIKAAKDKNKRIAEEIEDNAKIVEKLMAEINEPFSHLEVPQEPPPYAKGAKCEMIYPQLPVISQKGKYHIRDDEEQIIETGTAKTTIEMYPTSKSKKKASRLEARGELRIRRKTGAGDEDQSDSEENVGGYDPTVRRILARAERKGTKKVGRETNSRVDSSIESENRDSENENPSTSRGFFPAATSTRRKKDKQWVLRHLEEEVTQCPSDSEDSKGSEDLLMPICPLFLPLALMFLHVGAEPCSIWTKTTLFADSH